MVGRGSREAAAQVSAGALGGWGSCCSALGRLSVGSRSALGKLLLASRSARHDPRGSKNLERKHSIQWAPGFNGDGLIGMDGVSRTEICYGQIDQRAGSRFPHGKLLRGRAHPGVLFTGIFRIGHVQQLTRDLFYAAEQTSSSSLHLQYVLPLSN